MAHLRIIMIIHLWEMIIFQFATLNHHNMVTCSFSWRFSAKAMGSPISIDELLPSAYDPSFKRCVAIFLIQLPFLACHQSAVVNIAFRYGLKLEAQVTQVIIPISVVNTFEHHVIPFLHTHFLNCVVPYLGETLNICSLFTWLYQSNQHIPICACMKIGYVTCDAESSFSLSRCTIFWGIHHFQATGIFMVLKHLP